MITVASGPKSNGQAGAFTALNVVLALLFLAVNAASIGAHSGNFLVKDFLSCARNISPKLEILRERGNAHAPDVSNALQSCVQSLQSHFHYFYEHQLEIAVLLAAYWWTHGRARYYRGKAPIFGVGRIALIGLVVFLGKAIWIRSKVGYWIDYLERQSSLVFSAPPTPIEDLRTFLSVFYVVVCIVSAVLLIIIWWRGLRILAKSDGDTD